MCQRGFLCKNLRAECCCLQRWSDGNQKGQTYHIAHVVVKRSMANKCRHKRIHDLNIAHASTVQNSACLGRLQTICFSHPGREPFCSQKSDQWKLASNPYRSVLVVEKILCNSFCVICDDKGLNSLIPILPKLCSRLWPPID